MPTVDYDGIQMMYESDVNKSENGLMESIIDAVKDGELSPFSFQMEWAICDYCRGGGGHSRRFGAMTSDEFAEWSDESRESYLRGAYDERCDACHGQGKVYEMNEKDLPDEVREYIDRYRSDAYESASTSAMERRFGC
jgi:excinuclease UvrABC ATPase subunit